jgi:hypothetical protein
MLVDGVASLMLSGKDELAAAFVDSSTSQLAVRSLLCNLVQLPSLLWRRLVPVVGVAPAPYWGALIPLLDPVNGVYSRQPPDRQSRLCKP